MATLTVTTRGQVTFRKDVLEHLGIEPGGKIRLNLLPDGKAELEADKGQGFWQELSGVLKGKTNGLQLSLGQLDNAIAEAAASAALGDRHPK